MKTDSPTVIMDSGPKVVRSGEQREERAYKFAIQRATQLRDALTELNDCTDLFGDACLRDMVRVMVVNLEARLAHHQSVWARHKKHK